MGDRSVADTVVRELRGGLVPPSATGSRGGRRRSGPARRGRSGRSLLVPAALLGAAALVVGGLLTAAGALVSGGPPPAGTLAPARATDAPALPGWREVVEGVDAARDAALAAHDVEALRGLHLPGSRGLRADLRAVRALRAAGLRAEGLRTVVTRVDHVRGVDRPWAARTGDRADRAVLRVTDRRQGYALVGADGRVVQRVAAAPERTWRVVLERRERRWQVADVRQVGRSRTHDDRDTS